MTRRLVVIAVAALGLLSLGCDADMDDDDAKANTPAAVGTAEQTTNGGKSMEWETVTDPAEQAFTIDLPKGWKNEAYLKRKGVATVSIATSESPDGSAALFYGDPKMPSFVDPQAAVPQNHNDPNVRIEPYRPAEKFLPEYVKTRFAKLPGFKITGVFSEPELVEKNRQTLRSVQVPIEGLHSARVDFDFQQDGSVRHGSLFGSTLNMGGRT